MVACSLWVGNELLYLVILLMSEDKMEIDRWTDAASAAMWILYQTVEVKGEVSRKAKLSIYVQFMFQPSSKNEVANISAWNEFPL